jgi:hypothetical protein
MLGVSDEDGIDRVQQQRHTLRGHAFSERLHNEIRRQMNAQSRAALSKLRSDIFALCDRKIPWWKKILACVICNTEELRLTTNEECLRYMNRIDVEYCLSVYILGYSLTNPPPTGFFHLHQHPPL